MFYSIATPFKAWLAIRKAMGFSPKKKEFRLKPSIFSRYPRPKGRGN
jgi:hypothetical protein